MKIPFDIKFRPQIESGEYKVETKDGRKAHIVSWEPHDVGSALIVEVESKTFSGSCIVLHYKANGTTNAHPDNFLFLVTPEPEMTAFEYAMLRYVQEGANAKSDEELEELTKKHSAELLAIARKEIEKDLPRWKKMRSDMYCEDSVLSDDRVELRLGSHYILVSDLEKLPKED